MQGPTRQERPAQSWSFSGTGRAARVGGRAPCMNPLELLAVLSTAGSCQKKKRIAVDFELRIISHPLRLAASSFAPADNHRNDIATNRDRSQLHPLLNDVGSRFHPK